MRPDEPELWVFNVFTRRSYKIINITAHPGHHRTFLHCGVVFCCFWNANIFLGGISKRKKSKSHITEEMIAASSNRRWCCFLNIHFTETETEHIYLFYFAFYLSLSSRICRSESSTKIWFLLLNAPLGFIENYEILDWHWQENFWEQLEGRAISPMKLRNLRRFIG